MRDLIQGRRFIPAFLLVLVIGVMVALQVAPAFAASSTITVTTTTDELVSPGTGCSLREAIFVANNNSNASYTECVVTGTLSDDEIIFSGAGIGTHVLTAGQLIILDTAPTTINGGTGGTVYVSGNNASRVFLVGSGSVGDTASRTLTLLNLGVINGNGTGNVGGNGTSNGGCVYVATNSVLNVDASVIRNCTSSANGGGIFGTSGSSGTVGTIINLTNQATVRSNSAAYGGGIYMTTGQVTVNNNSCVCQNTAIAAGGGLYIAKDSNTLIGNPGLGFIVNNTAADFAGGAGVFLESNNSFVGNGARFYGNTLIAPIIFNNGSAWQSGGDNVGNHPNGSTPRRCINCCIVGNSGLYAVYQNVNVEDSDWRSNWWGDNWGPMIFDLDPTQTNPAIGSAVSNGDGIRGNGISAINVGLTDDGSFSTRPQGAWLLSNASPANGFPPGELPITTTAPADCANIYCTTVSSVAHNRTCVNVPTSCGLTW